MSAHISKIDSRIADLEAKMSGEGTTEDGSEGKPVPTNPTPVSVTPPHEPVAQVQPQPSVQEPAPVKPAVAAEPTETAEYWKNRWSTYKAATDLTLQGLRTEVMDLKVTAAQERQARIQFETQLMKLQKDDRDTENFSGLFKKDVVEVIGEDTANQIKDSIRNTVDSAVRPLQDELNRRDANDAEAADRQRKALAKQQKANFDRGLEVILRKNNITLATVNSDPNFTNWLAGIDEITGETRMALLGNAVRARDVKRASDFFVEFIMETTSAIEEEVSPLSESGNPAPVVQSGQEQTPTSQWTMAAVRSFMGGGYKNYPAAEAAKMEAEIDAALAAGTII